MAKIVLTAPATEMSDFSQNPFIAFTTSFPARMVPSRRLKHKIWYSPVKRNPDGTAKFAPNGLRKIEAMLLENGFSESDIAVVHPNDLDRFVNSETRVVAVSAMETMGLAFVSTTYSSFMNLGGRSMNADEFHRLMTSKCLRKHKPKIILGGAGSWQVERLNKMEEYGIDTIIIGEADSIALDIFKKAVRGQRLPAVVHGKLKRVEDVATIRNASVHGVVEVTRGCGRGCQFCAPTMRRKISFPLDKIMREARVNARAGSRMIMLASDDIFLYGAKQGVFEPNKKALLKLFSSMAAVNGIESIQPSHASLIPAKVNPELIRQISEIMLQKTWLNYKGKPFITAEIGVETGSTRLMNKYMKGKALPYSIDNWPELVTECIGILNDNSFYPLITMITGFPGENEDDRMRTMELIDDLKDARLYYAPLFFVPLEECILRNKFMCDLNGISESQWEFFARCWKHNVKMWNPALRKYVSIIGSLSYYFYYKWKYGAPSKQAIKMVAGNL